jgi:hypothetical protein
MSTSVVAGYDIDVLNAEFENRDALDIIDRAAGEFAG